MKRPVLALLALVLTSSSFAEEVLRWERLPLAIRLVVGQERVIFIDRNVRVGVPTALGESLRIQSTDGALYLLARAPFATARLQVQDVAGGPLTLLDVTAEAVAPGEPPLEPVRIVDDPRRVTARKASDTESTHHSMPLPAHSPLVSDATPIPVVLTRHAAQSLYASPRTVEPVPGIAATAVSPDLRLERLLPELAVRLRALAAWRLDEYWVTAIKVVNATPKRIELDPRALFGDFVAATFQHPDVGPAGDSTDTTVLYLVTRGHDLAPALPPATSLIDAAKNRPSPRGSRGADHEK